MSFEPPHRDTELPGLVGQVQPDSRYIRQVTGSVIHHHDVSAGVEGQSGGGVTHPGSPADDQYTFALVGKGIEQTQGVS